MNDYAEKRDFLRMPIDCELSFMESGRTQRYDANVVNLSSKGILFTSSERFEEGVALELLLTSSNSETPPMQAKAVVTRVTDYEPVFEIACAINEIK